MAMPPGFDLTMMSTPGMGLMDAIAKFAKPNPNKTTPKTADKIICFFICFFKYIIFNDYSINNIERLGDLQLGNWIGARPASV